MTEWIKVDQETMMSVLHWMSWNQISWLQFQNQKYKIKNTWFDKIKITEMPTTKAKNGYKICVAKNANNKSSSRELNQRNLLTQLFWNL